MGFIVCFLCFWYLFFFVLSCPYSDDYTGGFSEKMSIFKTQGTQVVLGSWKKPASGQKIFLLGASDVGTSFNPDVLKRLFPHYAVFNLLGGSANVTYMQDAFNIAQIMEQSLKGSYVIVGIWYGSFCADNKRWPQGMTDVRGAALRYGLYKFDGNRIELVIDRKWMPWAVSLLRPFLFCEGILGEASGKYEDFWDFVRNGFKANILNNPNASDQKYRQAAINAYAGRFGHVDEFSFDEQGRKLKELCQAILASGAKLIVVDMPLPQWHRDGSVVNQQYVVKKSQYIGEILKLPGVKYLDFSSQLPDSYFVDGVHSTEAGAWQMSGKLSEVINN